MKPAPASVTSYHTLGPGQVIGLFLARLLACLLRLQARGETAAPPHIAQMVSAADEMVHAYICNLAAGRLKSAGYTYAADALRTARAGIASPAEAEPATPEALIARLEDTIATFHQAQALSVYFARLVFCALCMIFTGELFPGCLITSTFMKRGFAIDRVLARQYAATSGRGPPAWPPPASSAIAGPRFKPLTKPHCNLRGRDPSAAIKAHLLLIARRRLQLGQNGIAHLRG